MFLSKLDVLAFFAWCSCLLFFGRWTTATNGFVHKSKSLLSSNTYDSESWQLLKWCLIHIYSIPYYVIYGISHHITLHCITSRNVTSHCITSSHTALYHDIVIVLWWSCQLEKLSTLCSYCSMMYRETILYYTVLCYAILCYTIRYYPIPSYIIL